MKTITIRFTETIRIPYPEGPRAVNALHGYPDGVPLDAAITDAHRAAAAAIMRSQVVELEAVIDEDGAARFAIVPIPTRVYARCAKCGDTIFQGQETLAEEGKPSHVKCQRCWVCHVLLRPGEPRFWQPRGSGTAVPCHIKCPTGGADSPVGAATCPRCGLLADRLCGELVCATCYITAGAHERGLTPCTRSTDWAISQLGIAHRDLGFAISNRTSEEHQAKLLAAIRQTTAQLWAAIRGATLPDAPSGASTTPDLCAQCGYLRGPAGELGATSCPVHGADPMGIEVGLIDIDEAAHSHGAEPPKS